ncbi:hypothetical protein RIF29_29915 [Crotalaria pallida]|uniref:Uncharacterized protein n=1 Tax=Crotalaria pallida TaxID=3830 RepID=A0AAN9HXV4_CROPI
MHVGIFPPTQVDKVLETLEEIRLKLQGKGCASPSGAPIDAAAAEIEDASGVDGVTDDVSGAGRVMRSRFDAISAKHQVEARGLAHVVRSGSAWTEATGAMDLAVAHGMVDQVEAGAEHGMKIGAAEAAQVGADEAARVGVAVGASKSISGAHKVCSKLRLMRKPLSNLNKEAFANIDKREMDLRDRLHCIQTELMSRPLDVTLQAEEKDIFM